MLYPVIGNSPAVQWLGLDAFTAVAPDSVPGQGLGVHECLNSVSHMAKKKQHIRQYILN